MIFLVMMLLVYSCCRKDGYVSGPFQNFHLTCVMRPYDSIASANKLIGKWKWISEYSIWTNTIYPADKNVVIIFKADTTFSETENSVVIAQGNWNLQIADANHWGVHTSMYAQHISGTIYFCDDKVTFITDYVDGPDNLFEKIN